MPLTAKYHLKTSLLLVSITRPTPFADRRNRRERTSPEAHQVRKLKYTWLQGNREKTTSETRTRSIRPTSIYRATTGAHTPSLGRNKILKGQSSWVTRATVKVRHDLTTTREQYIPRTITIQDKAYPREYATTTVQLVKTCIEFFNNQINSSKDRPKKQPGTQKRTRHHKKSKHQDKTELENTFIFSITRIQDYTVYRMTIRRSL